VAIERAMEDHGPGFMLLDHRGHRPIAWVSAAEWQAAAA
jgi:hypothetical protein